MKCRLGPTVLILVALGGSHSQAHGQSSEDTLSVLLAAIGRRVPSVRATGVVCDLRSDKGLLRLPNPVLVAGIEDPERQALYQRLADHDTLPDLGPHHRVLLLESLQTHFGLTIAEECDSSMDGTTDQLGGPAVRLDLSGPTFIGSNEAWVYSGQYIGGLNASGEVCQWTRNDHGEAWIRGPCILEWEANDR